LELLHGIIYLTKIVVPKSLNEMKIISTEKSEDACLSDQLSKKQEKKEERKKQKTKTKTKTNKQFVPSTKLLKQNLCSMHAHKLIN
jgi:hypothetical protein